MRVKENVLDAIEFLATDSIGKAGYDKTIQAQIVSCEDATIGKYRCRYQDAIFDAYSTSAEITYPDKSFVYILIPNNDLSKDNKMILGTTKKLGINYINMKQGSEDSYDMVGTNVLSDKTDGKIYKLYTQIKNYHKTIYKYRDNVEEQDSDEINIDVKNLQQYIKNSSHLLIGATIKTSIKQPLNLFRGHYGIIYTLRFYQKTAVVEGENDKYRQVLRQYVLDEDNMRGNPYKLLHNTRQYQIYQIDGENFIRIQSIDIFNKDFPQSSEQEPEENLADIEISKLELCCAKQLSSEEMQGVSISIATPKGFTYDNSIDDEDERPLIAQVKVKGNLVSEKQNLQFYWGREDITIQNKNDKYYNKYLGKGWKCLNNFSVIKQYNKIKDPTIDENSPWYIQDAYNAYNEYLTKIEGIKNTNYATIDDLYNDLKSQYEKFKNNIEKISKKIIEPTDENLNLINNDEIKDTVSTTNESSTSATENWDRAAQYEFQNSFIINAIKECQSDLKEIEKIQQEIKNENQNNLNSLKERVAEEWKNYFIGYFKNITEDLSALIDWIPANNTYIFRKSNYYFLPRETKIKVAVLYENQVFSKQIIIKNNGASYEIIVESQNGRTQYYEDRGHPNLICRVKEKDEEGNWNDIANLNKYTFGWAYINKNGVLQQLNETIEDNENLIDLRDRYNQIQQDIENGKYADNNPSIIDEKNKLLNGGWVKDNKEYPKGITELQATLRIDGNKIYNYPISYIDVERTFKCVVYNRNGINIGTGEIVLKNTHHTEPTAFVTIHNGDKVFQYNEAGIINNIQTQPLSFTIYDSQGNAIDDQIAKSEKNTVIRWGVPKNNTLLQIGKITEGSEVTEEDVVPILGTDYNYYKCFQLPYAIFKQYNSKKINNQIQLVVIFQGQVLKSQTNFTFVKQGDPGTNGTEFTVRISPNIENNEQEPWFPTITEFKQNNVRGYRLNYKISGSLSKFSQIDNEMEFKNCLKVSLFRNSEEIWNSSSSNNKIDDIAEISNVQWEILSNPLCSEKKLIEASNNNNNNNNNCIIKVKQKFNFEQPPSPLTIIKCTLTINGKKYSGTLPIALAKVENKNNQIYVKNDTGYKYVVYANDGFLPSYDSSRKNFEIQCLKTQNNNLENENYKQWDYDISHQIHENNQQLLLNYYEFFPCGYTKAASATSYFSKLKPNINNIPQDTVIKEETLSNQNYYLNSCEAEPEKRFDGSCVNIGILCKCWEIPIEKGSTKFDKIDISNKIYFGEIFIPIHFLLNKYGLDYLNDWDGNSIQIKDGSGVILTPQIGAGEKNSNNAFTGMLMGVYQDSNVKKNGLLGYNEGQQTIFLDSESGGAIFGKSASGGSITIDPSSEVGAIYSGNFWDSESYNKKGFPKTNNGIGKYYWKNYRNENFKPVNNNNKQGMIINLAQPEIFFGSGNFYVNEHGWMHAQGGGTLGGWTLKRRYLKSDKSIQIGSKGEITTPNNETMYREQLLQSSDGQISLCSGMAKVTKRDEKNIPIDFEYDNKERTHRIYSSQHEKINSNKNGFYLSDDGLSIGNKVKITNDGVAYFGIGATTGVNKKHWTINGNENCSYISYNTEVFLPKEKEEAANSNRVYIGTDGISLGYNTNTKEAKFSVDNQGKLHTQIGDIGGWIINTNKLTAGNISLNKNGSISGGEEIAEIPGKKEKINTVWSIDNYGRANFNYLTANQGGQIGGWTISSNYLKAGNLQLNKDGSISGGGWKINADGTSSFTHDKNHLFEIKMSGGAISSNGSGYLGGGGPSSSSPLSWTPTGVVLQGNTEIKNGVKIGSLQINNKGALIYGNGANGTIIGPETLFAPTVSGSQFVIDNITFDTDGNQGLLIKDVKNIKIGGVNTLSVRAIFSDGSYLEFKNGLLVNYHIVQS